jgi:hypothetical protein
MPITSPKTVAGLAYLAAWKRNAECCGGRITDIPTSQGRRGVGDFILSVGFASTDRSGQFKTSYY